MVATNRASWQEGTWSGPRNWRFNVHNPVGSPFFQLVARCPATVTASSPPEPDRMCVASRFDGYVGFHQPIRGETAGESAGMLGGETGRIQAVGARFGAVPDVQQGGYMQNPSNCRESVQELRAGVDGPDGNSGKPIDSFLGRKWSRALWCPWAGLGELSGLAKPLGL